MSTSYTEKFSLGAVFAIAELGMSPRMDELLRDTLDGHVNRLAIREEIEERITVLLQRDGVDEDTGEWFGTWSAERIVRNVLTAHGVDTTDVL